ncbi:MAG: DNA methyltransferase [Candidatus Caldarchaeum sp.]|uniref:Type II methyltransferase n=1 Tax=Caldiarchaeum subterraneum TaxID=311458 RepID=A0A7C5Q904_CALS0
MEIPFVREPRADELSIIPRWGQTASKILTVIKENGTVAKERLAQITGYSSGTINAQLSMLKRARLVRYVGKTDNLDQSSNPTPTASDTVPKLKMRLITWEEYRQYVEKKKFVTIEGVNIEVGKSHRISMYGPPRSYEPETTTVWSFPNRGDWATHAGDYRGNWSPYVPRNLILKYSKLREVVLDQMVGSGTTLVEAKLLGRNAIGVDINYEACILAMDRLNFDYTPLDNQTPVEIKVYHGDAAHLDAINDNSIDLIATHPPYWNIIPYSEERHAADLSNMRTLDAYLEKMREIASESFRVLKPGRYCAILIGDTRRHKHYVPISARVMMVFLKAGFILAEDIIKLQHKMKTTRELWRAQRFETYGFHKVVHEHLYIFRKPTSKAEYSKLKLSTSFDEA